MNRITSILVIGLSAATSSCLAQETLQRIVHADCRYSSALHLDMFWNSISPPSEYFTGELNTEVTNWLIAKCREATHDGYYTHVEFDSSMVQLTPAAAFFFEADPDLVLLVYKCFWDNSSIHIHSLYVVYIPASNKFYVLWEAFGSTVEESLNRILDEEFVLPQLSYLCKAAIMLYAKRYNLGIVPFAIVRSRRDIEVWAPVWWSVSAREANLSADWYARNALFQLFPASDSVFVQCTSAVREKNLRTLLDSEVLNKRLCELDWSGLMAPPSVEVHEDTVRVCLTVCCGYFGGEIARWEIKFSKAGRVVSMAYTEEPYYLDLPFTW